jgi:flagellar biosynthetic protein FliR
MPNLLAFNAAQFLGLFLIFARVSGVMITAPILNDQTIPPTVKIGFTFLLSLVFFPVVARPVLPANINVMEMALLVAGEVAIGVMIGFTAQLLFAGVSLAGEIIGFQMGVSMAHVFDPAFNTQTSVISEIKTVLALMLFVGLNGHHMFIEGLVHSYEVAGAGHVVLGPAALGHLTAVASRMFVVGLQVGAPLIVSLLAANLAMGLVARAVPQINIFVVGFPFTIALGLILMAASFPFFVEAIAALTGSLQELINTGVQALGKK